jgi:hypothetical protein
VAEVHFGKILKVATKQGWLPRYVEHDSDGLHDFTFWTSEGREIRAEVKTIRSVAGRAVVPIKVELQKTRTSNSDPTSRYYSRDAFDLIAVNVGRHTGDWSDFQYCWVASLPSHSSHPDKIKVLNTIGEHGTWHSKLAEALEKCPL